MQELPRVVIKGEEINGLRETQALEGDQILILRPCLINLAKGENVHEVEVDLLNRTVLIVCYENQGIDGWEYWQMRRVLNQLDRDFPGKKKWKKLVKPERLWGRLGGTR